jgi:glutamate 5-kinase
VRRIVIKLGSGIVADEVGALREDVLEHVCESAAMPPCSSPAERSRTACA